MLDIEHRKHKLIKIKYNLCFSLATQSVYVTTVIKISVTAVRKPKTIISPPCIPLFLMQGYTMHYHGTLLYLTQSASLDQ